MEVFLIPIRPDRYELYCEPASEVVSDQPAGTGFIARLVHRATSMLRDADERQRQGPGEASEPKGLFGRAQQRMLAWAAERFAEARLLWNLRRETEAMIAYPQDLTFEQALAVVRSEMTRDYERHRRWAIIDGFAFLVTFVTLAPLFILIPGVANLPAIYFGFRTVLHWFAMRGAAQGLHRVHWSGRSCPPLGELREAALLEQPIRDQRVHDIAARLRLQHLSTFFERVAVSPFFP